MQRAKLPQFGLLLALCLSLFPCDCIARWLGRDCVSSTCGNINISWPFRLKTQPQSCGILLYELVCENNRTIYPMKHGDFYVQDISYVNKTIHLLDVSLVNDNCSIPHSSSPRYSPSVDVQILSNGGGYGTTEFSLMYLLNCSMNMINYSGYIDASRCSTNGDQLNFLYFLDEGTPPSQFHQSCRIEAQVPIMLSRIKGLSTSDIYRNLMMGFHLSWSSIYIIDSLLQSTVARALITLFALLYLYIRSIVSFFLHGTPIQGDLFSTGPAHQMLQGIAIIFISITDFTGSSFLLQLN